MNPAHYVQSFKLDDGRPIRLRAISPHDKQLLLDGFRELSTQSIYYRFFSARKSLDKLDLNYLTNLDFTRHVAIGAAFMVDGREVPVAVGRYVILQDEHTAEISLTVLDAYQHQGIGALLFHQLAHLAHKSGLTRLVANVIPGNRAMLGLLEHSGLSLVSSEEEGVLKIDIELSGLELLH